MDKGKRGPSILSPALTPDFYTLPCPNTHLTHKGSLPSFLDKEELAPVCTAALYSKDYKVASGEHP